MPANVKPVSKLSKVVSRLSVFCLASVLVACVAESELTDEDIGQSTSLAGDGGTDSGADADAGGGGGSAVAATSTASIAIAPSGRTVYKAKAPNGTDLDVRTAGAWMATTGGDVYSAPSTSGPWTYRGYLNPTGIIASAKGNAYFAPGGTFGKVGYPYYYSFGGYY